MAKTPIEAVTHEASPNEEPHVTLKEVLSAIRDAENFDDLHRRLKEARK